jgi:hypothetical protein
LRQQRFARAGWAHEQDVGFLQLDFFFFAMALGIDTLVVIVHRDRENFFGAVLANHILIQHFFDLSWLGNRGRKLLIIFVDFFGNDVVAQPQALIADIHGWPGNQLFDFFLRLAAKRTSQ